MKKVYIPTIDEMRYMQNMGVNIYQYLLSKTIESLVMTDVVYEEEDMFEVSYEELSSFPEIIYTIAKMYPERISTSEQASKDINLCRKLIPVIAKSNQSINGLDYMRQFSDEVLANPKIINEIIQTLANNLQTSPRYRFEYQEPNNVLDNLFAREIPKDIISNKVIDEIICLEPAYLTELSELLHKQKDAKEIPSIVMRGSTRYASRHDIDINPFSNNQNNDVLTNPNERVKKLLKVLDRHRQYYKY